MKAKLPISLIVCCALLKCAGYAFASNPAQQGAANSTTSTYKRLSDDEPTTPRIEAKNHGTVSHQPTHNKHVSGKIPLPTPASAMKANRSKLVHNKSNGHEASSFRDAPHPTSIKPIAASKATNHNLRTHPVAGSAIDRGNFRNRYLTAIPEGIGGPARTTRNTTTLSGTAMGRRRAN
jgi:hypothetical protein